MAQVLHTPASSVSSIASPRFSFWSRGHSSKSSSSSISTTSSPIQTRDSLDLFGTQKRLEDVREEEDHPSRQICSFDDYRCDSASPWLNQAYLVSQDYSLADQDACSTTSGGPYTKRLRSSTNPQQRTSKGITSHFGGLSRRWRNRSAPGPPLSINTNTTPIGSPRPSFEASISHQHRSASLSSNMTGVYSPASMHSVVEEAPVDSEMVPIYIDQLPSHKELEEDRAQATTPLLPPTMMQLTKHESPIQSPLQSPSIAPSHYGPGGRRSPDRSQIPYLPSPPLSSRPSLASMPRSRTNTATQDIPTLQQLSERLDPWEAKLGHADFNIYPEPYRPNIIDLDHFGEFRQNWEHARKQYAQHLARTIEHYGDTSKVYRLTEEKWSSIDDQWKKHDLALQQALRHQLQRLGVESSTPDSPVSLLEKPSSRVVVPQLDKSGKFPEIGDNDIIGPLSVGTAKVPELQRGNTTPPASPRKRDFFKTFFGRL